MLELLDTFDKEGNKTGTIQKGEHTNDFVKCCSCFVVNSKNQVLIEKRGKTVLDAGKLDLCSGHIQSNETPFEGMIRELNEELGIKKEESKNIKELGKVKLDFNKSGGEFKCITYVYMLKRDKDLLELQDEEVKSIQYHNLNEIISMIKQGKTRLVYDDDNSKDFDLIFQKLNQELRIF